MTDRDTFAAAALTGLLAAPTDKDRSWDYWARLAYEAADAMLARRTKNGTGSGFEAGPDPDSRTWDTYPARQPSLANAEREAIESVIWDYQQNKACVECAETIATLRGMLERLASVASLRMTKEEQNEVAIAACAAAAIGKEKSAIVLSELLARHRTWGS